MTGRVPSRGIALIRWHKSKPLSPGRFKSLSTKSKPPCVMRSNARSASGAVSTSKPASSKMSASLRAWVGLSSTTSMRTMRRSFPRTGDQFHESARNRVERQNQVGKSCGHSGTRHAPHHGTLLVLSDDSATCLPNGPQPLHAVLTHAREDQGDDSRIEVLGDGVKEHSSGRSEAADRCRVRELY